MSVVRTQREGSGSELLRGQAAELDIGLQLFRNDPKTHHWWPLYLAKTCI